MDFNINTTQAQANQAGDLDSSGNFLGDSLGMNAMKQKEQRELVAQAAEKTKMAKLGSKQKTEADDEGVNPELKDYMSKAEALEYIAHEWKLPTDDPEITKLAESMPEQVERHMVQTLIRKKDRFPSRPVGQPFAAKGERAYPTQTDGSGSIKLEDGEWYQAMADDQGAVSYIPSGESSAHLNHEGRDDKSMRKEWVKLVYDMDITGASSRKALGVNYSSYIAAIRGENLLHQPVVTSQNMKEVTRDLTRILQQGVPTDSGSEGMEYHSLVGDLARKLQYWEGKPKNAIPPEDKLYLEDSFKRLKTISQDVIETKIRHMEAGFGDVIAAHQQEWDKITDNLRHPPQPNMDAYTPSEPVEKPGMVHQMWNTLTGNGAQPVDKPVKTVNNPVVPSSGAERKTATGIAYSISDPE